MTKRCIVLYCIVLYCIVLYCIVLYCIVLYCFGSYPVLVMGVVPSLMGNVCVYICSGQSEEARGGHEHRETVP